MHCLTAAFVALLVALYQLRRWQVARQFNIRLDERIGERTRVARELHDTLLQTFLSASMQLQVAADYVTEDSPAKPLLGRILEITGEGIDECRSTIEGLRSPDIRELDLEQAFSRIPHEFDPRKEVGFHIIVQGRLQPLRPAIRDEVYRIGREALINAFRHSRATTVEIEIEFAARHLRLVVCDNGCGIDSQVVQSGRAGHWGLAGMRERAERIGGRINIWEPAFCRNQYRSIGARQGSFSNAAFSYPNVAGAAWSENGSSANAIAHWAPGWQLPSSTTKVLNDVPLAGE
jgi:signal transduction histidine kinase